MARIYSAALVGLDSEIGGAHELARGSAAEVARSVLEYGGEIGRIINVYEIEGGHEPHHVDQVQVGPVWPRTTRLGWELRQHGDSPRREWWDAIGAAREAA